MLQSLSESRNRYVVPRNQTFAKLDSLSKFGQTADIVQFKGFSPASLRSDKAFTNNGLTPAVATEEDLPEINDLLQAFIQEEAPAYSFENLRLSLQRRTDAELKAYGLKLTGLQDDVMGNFVWICVKLILKPALRNPEWFQKLMTADYGDSDALGAQLDKARLHQRFIDNPKGALLVLKNKENEIVGVEGINQFQDTHDFQMTLGILDAVDPKHALLSSLYIKPEYRGKGIGTALEKNDHHLCPRSFGIRLRLGTHGTTKQFPPDKPKIRVYPLDPRNPFFGFTRIHAR